jgi:thioredoxin-related protein
MIKKIVTNIILLLILQFTLHAKDINLDYLAKQAGNEHKHLFVWLHKDGCGYCENMKEFTLQNEIVKAYINKHFIYQHINISKNDDVIYKGLKTTAKDFAIKAGYNFYPSSLFLDKDANIIFADVGFMDGRKLSHEEKFYKILHFIDEKRYKEMDFDEYQFTFDKEF